MPLFWASDFEVMMFDVGLQLTKQKAIREKYSRCFKSCNIYGKFSKYYRNAIILDFVQLILQFFH
jgi:hypothetical protein